MLIILRMENVILAQRHTIRLALLSLFITTSAFIIFIYAVNSYDPNIIMPIIVLFIMGLFIGSLLPSILSTWVIILLTTIGSSFLVFGQMLLPLPSKLLLILVLPLVAGITIFNRRLLGTFSSKNVNRDQIERYIQHYNQATKLQGAYNAEKMYQKIVNFIQQDENLWVHVTAINWVHSQQFRQFHETEYQQTLSQIAKVLKNKRLPSESLYYLEKGTFLIVSYETTDDSFVRRNQITKNYLNEVNTSQITPQFQWGHLKVDAVNVGEFLTFDKAMKHVERMMETDLVVEYLKEVEQ
jgi:hypothetical protein